MVKISDFTRIRSSIEEQDKKRGELISNSTGFIKKTKIVIYSLHRGEKNEAGILRKELAEDFRKIKKSVSRHQALYYSGIYKIIVQEYIEAIAYYHFVTTGKLLGFSGLGVSPEHYLLGLCDLTGELGRKAVNATIKKDYKSAVKIKDFVSALYGEMLRIDFRNSELRRKIDEVKNNLKRLEDLVVNISLRK